MSTAGFETAILTSKRPQTSRAPGSTISTSLSVAATKQTIYYTKKLKFTDVSK
jgi:hypothetical protein